MIVKDGDEFVVNVTMTREEALLLHNALLYTSINDQSVLDVRNVDPNYLRGQLAGISDGGGISRTIISGGPATKD